ncbi:glycosyltransferase family 87 protein [Roseibium sediminis]|uniref:glycosyltransferase family 87 protein n=1 Tax=Roseibium sediminis TaxID=1775174 RepID=UPI00123D3A0C|nr:glycosyltransferase family 87 protein [Roseibium sediminis]
MTKDFLHLRQLTLQFLRTEEFTAFLGALLLFVAIVSSVVTIDALKEHWLNAHLLPATLADEKVGDFAAFYRAGEMALAGEASQAYDAEKFIANFSEERKSLLYLNPPHFQLFAAPMALLPYGVAKLLFLIASVAALCLIVQCMKLEQGPLAFWVFVLGPPLLYNIYYFQLSPFITLFLVFALLNHRNSPVLSGVLLAIATVKPQYGLLVPVFLLLHRSWLTFAVATIGTGVLILCSALLFGSDSWRIFFETVSGVHSQHIGMNYPLMVTVSSSLGKLGISGNVAFAIAGLSALFSLAAVYLHVLKANEYVAIGLVLLTTILAAPSFMLYDWPHICAAIFLIAAGISRFSIRYQIAAAIVWSLPIVLSYLWSKSPIASYYLSAFVPVFVLVLIVLTYFEDSSRAPIRTRSV